MGIYTKKGDKGKTSLINSKKQVSKASKVIEVIGTIDEANSFLGIVVSESKSADLATKIIQVQNNLFTINAILAGAKISFSKKETESLEKYIDNIDKKLPKLTNFLIPGGNPLAAKVMYARTLVRRAERKYAILHGKDRNISVQKYLNRLSDFLFMLFRLELNKTKSKEIIWKPK